LFTDTELAGYSRSEQARKLILKIKDIVQPAIKTLRPDTAQAR